MRLLLDTHTLLWFIMGDPRLSSRARELIEDIGNTRLVSIASLWEIAIKANTGRLELVQPFYALFPRLLDENDMAVLPITLEHVTIIASLPHHRDPFDRMLVAQSMVEGLPVLSVDPILDSYGIQRLW